MRRAAAIGLALATSAGLAARLPAAAQPEKAQSAAVSSAATAGLDTQIGQGRSPVGAEPAAEGTPLTLARAHALALQNHPGIAAADDSALASQEEFKEAHAALLPQVSLYGSAVEAGSANTRIMAGGINNPSVLDRVAYGAGLNQLITDFGHTTHLVASSRLEASAQGQAAVATREQVLLEVDRSYFGVLQAQAVVQVSRQALETRQLLLDRVSILAANKLKSELDVSFARVALEDARLLLEKARNDLDSSRATLSAALGIKGLRQFSLIDDASAPAAREDDITVMIDSALRNRPELVRLRDERDAAEHLAQSMRDARLPTISAEIVAGDAPSHDVRLPDSYSAAGIMISMPLFAGGYYTARQHAAEHRANMAAETLRASEDEVARDVRVAWLNLKSARERLRTTAQLSRYAADAYQLAETRYKVGSSSIIELSQAQLQLTSAQIGEANARYDVLILESTLRYQTGELLLESSRS